MNQPIQSVGFSSNTAIHNGAVPFPSTSSFLDTLENNDLVSKSSQLMKTAEAISKQLTDLNVSNPAQASLWRQKIRSLLPTTSILDNKAVNLLVRNMNRSLEVATLLSAHVKNMRATMKALKATQDGPSELNVADGDHEPELLELESRLVEVRDISDLV